MEEHTEGKRLIAGTNCYFNYEKWEEYKRLQSSLNRPPVPPFEQFLPQSPTPRVAGKLEQKPAAKKKKKKKKKTTTAAATTTTATEPVQNPTNTNKAKSVAPKFSVGDVSFVDPDADYPESRLIKVGPNGDLIVESLDEEYPRQMDEKNDRIMVPPVPAIPDTLAQKILGFSDEQKRFWKGLSPQAQKELFTIDADAITESIRQQQRELANRNIQAEGGPGHEHSWAQNSKCYCSRCERNDLQIVNIIDEGFDMYMEELMAGLWAHFELQFKDVEPEAKFVDIVSAENAIEDKYIEAENIQRFAEIEQIERAGVNAGEMDSTVRNLELFYYIENILIPMIERDFSGLTRSLHRSDEYRRVQVDTLSCVHQILRLIQSRNDRNRLLRDTKGEGVRPLTKKEFQRMAVAENLIDCLYSFSKEGLPGIPKAMEFVKILSSVGRAGNNQFPDVTEQMSKFAEMFQNNDGKSFIDIVAKLKASETAGDLDEGEDEENPELEHYALKNPFSHCKCDFHTQLSEKFESARSKAFHEERDPTQDHAEEEDDEHDDCDIDDDHDCDHDHDHEYHDEDEDDLDDPLDDPETDEEEAEERRFKELRGFFFMEARKIIVKRFQESYKQRVSEDRTKKFIEELEAEENAKKEKELKKLKQKEKQKEKKRLQQLEKEEKRKQKEAEEQEKAAILKRKQEELRAEQKRREEEIRMKKEKEKMKKIEALKQKEAISLENKLKAEQQAAEASSPAKSKPTDNTLVQDKKKKSLEKEKEKSARSQSSKPSQTKAESSNEEKSSDNPPKKTPVTSKQEKRDTFAKKSPSIPSIQNTSEKTPPIVPPTSGSERTETTATLDLEVGPHQVILPNPEVKKPNQDVDPGISFLPPKNHLLEQLYHARPRTVSTTSGDSTDFFNEPGSASRMGTGYSPSKKSVSAYQTDSWNHGNTGSFPTDSMAPPSLDRPSFANNGAGSANTWAARNSHDAFNALPLASPLMSNLPASTMWIPNYPSRGNSIWGSTLANNEPQASNLWAPQAAQSDLAATGITSVNNKELVQSAAFKAIQEVRSSKEANANISSAMRIFQTAKTILNNPSLKMSEFLSALHSSAKYQFEIIYDDFGSVTDINANIQPERIFGTSSTANRSPSPQQTHAAPPLFHAQPPFAQLDPGLKLPGFAPNSLHMNQPLGQPNFQPGLNQDPFQASNAVFQPQIPINPHFTPNTGIPNQQMPGPENIGFQQGPFRSSSENVSQFDSKISETMQGSLNQLGIGQVRSGIW